MAKTKNKRKRIARKMKKRINVLSSAIVGIIVFLFFLSLWYFVAGYVSAYKAPILVVTGSILFLFILTGIFSPKTLNKMFWRKFS